MLTISNSLGSRTSMRTKSISPASRASSISLSCTTEIVESLAASAASSEMVPQNAS